MLFLNLQQSFFKCILAQFTTSGNSGKNIRMLHMKLWSSDLLPSCRFICINMCHARQRLGDGESGSEEKKCACARDRALSLCHTRSSSSTLLIDRFTSNKSKDVNKKIRQYTGNLVIFSQLWSWLVLKKNRESSMSETETRPRPNAVESETRPRPSKSGLETKTGLENNKPYEPA